MPSTANAHTRMVKMSYLLFVAAVTAAFIVGFTTAALADIGFLSTPIGQPPAIRTHRVVATPIPPPTPAPRSTHPPPRAAPVANGSGVWDRLAACESGGNWGYNGGSGYDGGLQFLPSTWRAAGGTKYAPYAHQATREQQIAVARSWLAKTSWSQWPACARKLGLR